MINWRGIFEGTDKTMAHALEKYTELRPCAVRDTLTRTMYS